MTVKSHINRQKAAITKITLLSLDEDHILKAYIRNDLSLRFLALLKQYHRDNEDLEKFFDWILLKRKQ